MGRIIVEQIISADGFAAAPDGSLDFFQLPGDFDSTDPGQMAMLERVDAILLGANTYRMFAAYWPTADESADPVAGPINALPKHVVSSTLESAPWGTWPPAQVERGDGVEIARALARRYEGDVIVWGSLQLAAALLAADAVDSLRLRVVPVLIGAGLALAPGLRTFTPLALDSVDAFPSGHVTLAYDLRR
ncbi:dihydrofolate reductase family protein [Planctomonas deserti]|uniref:dihydrofolate reductase family protein n=1 Tax=Planctomonas deserti TaxID=2144185 RepID=UPI000D3CDFA7|nr:dihydrofolate reductase family protein [Planctomonas deserti]